MKKYICLLVLILVPQIGSAQQEKIDPYDHLYPGSFPVPFELIITDDLYALGTMTFRFDWKAYNSRYVVLYTSEKEPTKYFLSSIPLEEKVAKKTMVVIDQQRANLINMLLAVTTQKARDDYFNNDIYTKEGANDSTLLLSTACTKISMSSYNYYGMMMRMGGSIPCVAQGKKMKRLFKISRTLLAVANKEKPIEDISVDELKSLIDEFNKEKIILKE